jgi:nucleotide-binding universal stress UspA family protein
MTVQPNVLVVGVDGGEGGIAAVRYAAVEARHDGLALLLVHVMPHAVAMSPMTPLITSGTFHEVAERSLATARHVAEEAAGPHVAVRTDLRSGTRAHGLVEAGEGARAIVLGRRERPGLSGLVTGSVSTHVATRAHCAVVSVPETWQPRADVAPVVVGVDDPAASGGLLEAAFAAAAGRGAPLTVLHTWHLPGPYDDLVVERVSGQAWHDQAVEDIEKAIAPLRVEHPAVRVEVDVRHQLPAAALMGAGEGAGLLLVGRRGRGAPLGFHLGGVARVLLTRAHCPVEIVPLHRPRSEAPPS